MNRLIEIGFKPVGTFKLNKEGELELLLEKHKTSNNVIYTILINSDPKYVGKTTRTLYQRMMGYINPGPTQSTNIRINELIKKELRRNNTAEIFAFVDTGLVKYGKFNLNLASGLEDSIIEVLNLEWNLTGKKRRSIVSEKAESLETVTLSKQEGNLKFTKTLGEAYFNRGFINVPVMVDKYLGEDKSTITFIIESSGQKISGYINRTANTNGTARLKGGTELRDWIQENYTRNDKVTFRIISKNEVAIET